MSAMRVFLSVILFSISFTCGAQPVKLALPTDTAIPATSTRISPQANTEADNGILFNRRVYDTPTINAAQFAQQHRLANATPYTKALCHLPDYQCVNVDPSDTWIKLFPDPTERSLIMRLNRTNVALKYRSWILVPRYWRNLDFTLMSPFPLRRQADGHRHLIISLTRFAFAAYDREGELVRWGAASGGRRHCPLSNQSCASVKGNFTIYRMHGADCYSRTYPLVSKGGAPMPYCMFYHKGYAIHASTLSGFLNHSRGCIRLFYDDAKWLNQSFVRIGTRVNVS